MREILFRGKSIDNGEWVFGYYTELPEGDIGATLMAGTDELLCEDTADYIISIETKQCPSFSPANPIQVFDADSCKVHRETVGQYTGLTDKNGKKIFEGDIVQLHYFYEAHDPSTLGAYEAEETIVAIISVWDMGVGFDQVGGNLYGYLHDWLESPQDELEVIGTIYDNPELLEVKE